MFPLLLDEPGVVSVADERVELHRLAARHHGSDHALALNDEKSTNVLSNILLFSHLVLLVVVLF